MVIYRYGRKIPIECRYSGPGQEPYTVRFGTVSTSTMDTTTTSVSTPTTEYGVTRDPPPLPVQCAYLPQNSQNVSDAPELEPSLLMPAVGQHMPPSTTPTSTTKLSDPEHETLIYRPTSSTKNLSTSSRPKSSTTPLSTSSHIFSSERVKHLFL